MTLYAHVNGSTVDTVSNLPALYFDGTVWHDWRGPGPWRTQPSSAGWFPIMLSPRPADTDTTTHDESVALVDGQPVQTWTPRPWTTDELAARSFAADREAARLAVRAILDTINAQLDEARAAKVTAQAVLDATAPTNVAQVWTQVKNNTRAIRDTDNALVGIGQGVKDIARLLKDS